jgi:hypothetical protein
MGVMVKVAVAVQVLIVLLIVGYGTWQLFLGNFAASMATFPLLLVYYLFVSVRHRR